MRVTKHVKAVSLASLLMTVVALADPPDNLAAGGNFSIRLLGGQYTLSGAINGSGPFTSSSAYNFAFLNDGTGLDWQLRVRDLVNAIQSDFVIRYNATVLPNGDIQWDMNAFPNDCTLIRLGGQDVPFLLTRIWGRWTATMTSIDCANDPLGARTAPNINIQLNATGGDAGNFLQLEGYAFACQEIPTLLTYGNVYSVSWVGYGGGVQKSKGNVVDDCAVNDDDLLLVLFNFGINSEDADVNGDGIVNDEDLLLVLFNFGAGN